MKITTPQTSSPHEKRLFAPKRVTTERGMKYKPNPCSRVPRDEFIHTMHSQPRVTWEGVDSRTNRKQIETHTDEIILKILITFYQPVVLIIFVYCDASNRAM